MSERNSMATGTRRDPLEVARGIYDNKKCEWILENCLYSLLNNKSLYQSISASDDLICKVCFNNPLNRYSEATKTKALKYLKNWIDSTESHICMNGYCAGRSYYQIQLPKTVKTYCELCKCVTTHNPEKSGDCYSKKVSSCYIHVFHAEYQCQDCKSAQVSFMVMRKGMKFQIMGRSPIEVSCLPTEMTSQLVDDERDLFGEALMAYKTGSELAAVCLLRVALEAYLRRVTGNQLTGTIVSGEELYEQYKKKLPKDFCLERVVSLGKIYNDLSAVMHTAQLIDRCFETNFMNIYHYFQFLALMPLKEDPEEQENTRAPLSREG